MELDRPVGMTQRHNCSHAVQHGTPLVPACLPVSSWGPWAALPST